LNRFSVLEAGGVCAHIQAMTINGGSTSSLSSVIAAAGELQSGRGLPPVHLWNPPHCGEIDIRIGRDGRWRHEGAPIGRDALVRLFSTVLRKESDGFYLVTPAEKLKIVVEDAPFIAVQVDRSGDAIRFLTNVGDWVEAGPEHAIRVETDAMTGEPAPYVHIRGQLEARMTRPIFYELVEMAEPEDGPGGACLIVHSHGVAFSLGSVEIDGAAG
jgi:hypothetical protein